MYGNNPIDVIKTRMQGETAYSSVIQCAKSLYQQGGAAIFYRGVTPRVVRVTCNAAIVFFTYDAITEFIQLHVH